MHHNRIKKSRFNIRLLTKGALTVITAMLLFLFPVNIRASPGSITAKEAAFLYGDELEHAWYSYCGENIFVTIRKYRSSMSEYCLTHVVINDPSQIRSALANDTFGGERERSSDASARLGWVVGINGSNFNWDTGEPQYAGICIKDRQVMKGELTDGREICLSDDGSLFSPSKGLSGEELFAMGVTDSWSCGDTLLIANGEGINYGIQSEQYRYPRTAVGMVRPGEYYLINAGSGNYEGGMTYDEVRNVLLGCGCTFGKCMDGGGSSTLIFRNEVVNTPAEKNAHERAMNNRENLYLLWVLRLAALIGKLINTGDADRLKVLAAAPDVFIGVVVRDMGHAHDDTLGHAIVAQEPLQVVEHTLVILTCVTPVDVGVNVLDVNEVFVDKRQQSLQVPTLHIQGCFHRKMPLGRSQAAEGLDELAADGRFTAAKGDTPARGEEIEVVDHHLTEQLGRGGRP